MSQLQLPTQTELNNVMRDAGLEPNEPADTGSGNKGELKTPTKAFGVRVALIKVLPATTEEQLYAMHTIFNNDIAFLAPQDWDKANHGLKPLASNPTLAQKVYYLSRISQIQEYTFLLDECKKLKASGNTQKLIYPDDIDAEQYNLFAATYAENPFSYLLYTKGEPAEFTVNPQDTLAMLDEFMQKPKGKRGK